MSNKSKWTYIVPGAILYLVLPVAYLLLGDFPTRTVLKESLSILTIAAFFLMLGQFYLARSNKPILKGQKMSAVSKIHKVLGYVFIPVLMLHPFFIVIPRFYEAGIDPADAFKTILATYNNAALVFGMIAWVLMVVLGITSLIRKNLSVKYASWRYFHGILSIVFIAMATWHAVDLGRHTDTVMSVYMILLSLAGIILLLKIYFSNPLKTGKNNAE